VSGLKDEKLILKNKPTRKLKQTSSILEYFKGKKKGKGSL